jgi:hypothetical protein
MTVKAVPSRLSQRIKEELPKRVHIHTTYGKQNRTTVKILNIDVGILHLTS